MRGRYLVPLFCAFLLVRNPAIGMAHQEQCDNVMPDVWAKAEKNDPIAENNLGAAYLAGTCVKKDYAESAKWWRKAAIQGNADAQAMLGIFYNIGLGVPKDANEAFKWTLSAAEQGNVNSQGLVAAMYRNGEGVKPDDFKAAEWATKAAENGHIAADMILASLYRDGSGGFKKDLIEEDKWLILATSGPESVPDFLKERVALEKTMSPSEKAKAQSAANEWKASHRKAERATPSQP